MGEFALQPNNIKQLILGVAQVVLEIVESERAVVVAAPDGIL